MESKDPYSLPCPASRERKSYDVYIMGSLSGTLYIGMTSNLKGRVFEHRFHRLGGFTDKYDVERLLYYESFDDVHQAINREKRLKGWRRAKKIALIEALNPKWVDLARDWFPWMKSPAGNRGASTPRDDSLREPSRCAQHDKNKGNREEEVT